ncbi:kinase-like protein [Artomyces pyxidatus]|uniref:Kinase-like protein n=1 Tax=Artomyces pyxidatus TaxID=48021 RepID=A0ACB8TGM9_9AGAM|nr:kinase-like protein [Artomyces pyxidatus]
MSTTTTTTTITSRAVVLYRQPTTTSRPRVVRLFFRYVPVPTAYDHSHPIKTARVRTDIFNEIARKLMYDPDFLDIWRGRNLFFWAELKFHLIQSRAERKAEDARERATLAMQAPRVTIEAAPTVTESVQFDSPPPSPLPEFEFSPAPSPSASSFSAATSVSSDFADVKLPDVDLLASDVNLFAQSATFSDLFASSSSGRSLHTIDLVPATPVLVVHVSSPPVKVSKSSAFGVDDLQPIKILGAGAFGTVFLAKDRMTGMKLAVKVIPKTTGMLEVFLAEQEALRALAGRRGFLPLHASWHDQQFFYLATEYCANGDLMSEMDRWGRMPALYVRHLAAELILALDDLHTQGMIHRDIKPENILFDDQGHLLVADFGLVRIFGDKTQPPQTRSAPFDVDDADTAPNSTRKACGSLNFMAPEVLKMEPYSYGVDFWAVGVLLFFLLTGRMPFGADFPDRADIIMSSIIGEDIRFEDSDFVESEMQDFVYSLLMKDPAARPSVSAMKDHPLFFDIDWESMAAGTVKPPSVPVPHKTRSSGAGLVIPTGKAYAAGEDPFPNYTYTSPVLRPSPDPVSIPSIPSVSLPSTPSASLPSNPSASPSLASDPRRLSATIPSIPEAAPTKAATEQAPKPRKFEALRNFFSKRFGGNKAGAAKAFTDPTLGASMVIATVQASQSSSLDSSSPYILERNQTSIPSAGSSSSSRSSTSLPPLTIFNILEPECNRTPIPTIPTSESGGWTPQPRITDSMLPRPSSLMLRWMERGFDGAPIKATKRTPAERVRRWFHRVTGTKGGSAAKAVGAKRRVPIV